MMRYAHSLPGTLALVLAAGACSSSSDTPEATPPAAGDLDVQAAFASADGKVVTAVFSKAVAGASVTAGAFKVTKDGADFSTASAAQASDTTTVAVTLTAPLAAGGAYKLVTKGLLDADGKTTADAKATGDVKGMLYLNMI
jgi:hypothetical protein